MGWLSSIGSALNTGAQTYAKGPSGSSIYAQKPSDDDGMSIYSPSKRPPKKLYGDLDIQYGAPPNG